VGTGLADLNKAQTLQSAGSFVSGHIARNLQENANTRSSTKWRRMK
jgi:hypothetical protein